MSLDNLFCYLACLGILAIRIHTRRIFIVTVIISGPLKRTGCFNRKNKREQLYFPQRRLRF